MSLLQKLRNKKLQKAVITSVMALSLGSFFAGSVFAADNKYYIEPLYEYAPGEESFSLKAYDIQDGINTKVNIIDSHKLQLGSGEDKYSIYGLTVKLDVEGNGKAEAGNTGLINGDTLYNTVNEINENITTMKILPMLPKVLMPNLTVKQMPTHRM